MRKTALSSLSNDVRLVVVSDAWHIILIIDFSNQVASEGYRSIGQRRFRSIEDFNLTSESSDSTKDLELRRYGMFFWPKRVKNVSNPITAYTKLANILFAKQLQKTFDQDGVPSVAMSLHPGRIVTGKFT